MKNIRILCAIALFTLVACKSGKIETDTKQIDLISALDHLSELKVSDIAGSIRFIPLETTDESLIGNNPAIKIFGDKIIVTTGKQCLLFDKDTGKFHGSVGHIGEDPEAYSSTNCYGEDETGLLYFFRRPGQLMQYTTNGQFVGKIKLPESNQNIDHIEFFESEIVVYYNNMTGASSGPINFYDKAGSLKDSILTLIPTLPYTLSDIQSISVYRDKNRYGNMAISGVLVIPYKDEQQITKAVNVPTLWKNNNHLRYKETFNDTIYSIINHKLEPYLTFNTGVWHWPATERAVIDGNEKRIVITYTTETDRIIFFQCIKGLHTEPVVYNGIYDKASRKTALALANNKLTDDIAGFMPVQPVACSLAGEFAAIVEAPDALEWAEEHPEYSANPELAFLKKLNEDMNPIVVLMK